MASFLSLVFATVLVSAASAAGATAGHYLFKGPHGTIALDLAAMVIVIDGREYALTSCSNDTNLCYTADEIGFGFIAPKRCPVAGFFPSDRTVGALRTHIVGVVPHHQEAAYITSGHPSFLFIHDWHTGLTALEYDPAGQAYAEGRSAAYSRGFEFGYSVDGPIAPFVCVP